MANTSFSVGGSFVVSAISLCIGFGIAYLIDRNVKENVEKKWLRVMASIASIAIGAGLAGIINHVMGTVVFGFVLDGDKVLSLLLANLIVFPIIFYTPVWISKFKNRTNEQVANERTQFQNIDDDDLLVSAVLGNKNAQFKIGQQYWLGEERVKDARLAYAWLKIAKDSGSDASKFYLVNTVYKQIDSNDANNSIKLYEDIKNAIKSRDALLCELIINKSLDDRNIKVKQSEEAVEKEKIVNIDFSLHTNEYKEKYGVNDYDYAKAINEMNGVLADAPVRTDLMNECIATTADVKQAQKKYIYTRAFQISKSINRDAPHIVKADASKLFPQEMMDVFGERQSEKKPKKIEETESFSNWAFTNAGKGLVVGLAIIFGTIGVINLLTNSSVPSADKKEEKSSNKNEDNKPNFFFNDMTYDLKNCEIKNEKNEAIFISKIQTSNDERTGVIHGDKKRTFAGCLLFGRDYTCTDEEDNKKIKIIFDVIYENLTFQKFRNNEINENDLEVEIFCEAFAVYK